jgi:hypothetical protein
MSIARLGEAIENPSVTQIMAAYPSKEAFDMAAQQGKIKPTTEAGIVANIYNRIVNEALARKAQSELTVFQENTGAVPQPQMGLAAAQQMQGQPQMQGQGLSQIPVPDQMFEPQGMAGGGIVAMFNGGTPEDRMKERMTLAELQEYNRTKRIPARLQIMADPSVSGRMVDPMFATETPTFSGMLGSEGFDMPLTGARFNESVIAQAQRGEGPNVQRSGAPADVAVVPQGGPEIRRPTGIQAPPTPTPVVKKPEGEKKPLSIFDEAANAANKLKAYKTQFGITDADPDAAMREKLKELQQGTKEERREAAYMAMTMAGLGIMGGTSPYFAANLKEAIPALKEYGVAKRDIKKAEMEYTKMEGDLNRAADARKRGDMELALKLEESAQDRELRLRQVVAAERAANKPSQLRELIDMASGGDKTKAQQLAAGVVSARGKTGLTAAERANLEQNALKNAAVELRNNREYNRLANSKDPADKAKAKQIRDDLIAQYMNVGRSGLGGATFLGYED